jgi:hypothetical protein
MTPARNNKPTDGALRAAKQIEHNPSFLQSTAELIDRETGVRELTDILENIITEAGDLIRAVARNLWPKPAPLCAAMPTKHSAKPNDAQHEHLDRLPYRKSGRLDRLPSRTHRLAGSAPRVLTVARDRRTIRGTLAIRPTIFTARRGRTIAPRMRTLFNFLLGHKSPLGSFSVAEKHTPTLTQNQSLQGHTSEAQLLHSSGR